MTQTIHQLPLFARLAESRRVLIAGCGGGFDVYCGLPLFFALRDQGKDVFLASLTFANTRDVSGAERVGPVGTKIDARCESDASYFPELTLSRWLAARRDIDAAVYCLDKTGVKPLRATYRAIIGRHGIDTLILVDGGTDSLLRGDEQDLGTPAEDMLSVVAASQLELPRKLLACLGFGVDAYHGVCHAHFLENVAALSREGAFHGAFSLLPSMPEVAAYLEAVNHAAAKTSRRPSIVNGSIASAIEGDFGDVHRTPRTRSSELFINPLMALLWAFDVDAVAAKLLYREAIAETESFAVLCQRISDFHRNQATRRRWRGIPH